MMRRVTKMIDNKLLDLRTPSLAPVNFTVTPELIAQSEMVDVIKDNMKEVVKVMKKQAKANEVDISRNAELSDAFEAFSKACLEQNAQSQSAPCLRDAAAFVQKLNDLLSRMEEKIQQVLCTTMETFVTDGLKPALEKKRQYDREAMDYDNLITKHKTLKKSAKTTPQKEKESEQQVSDAKDAYLVSEKETLELLKQASLKGEILTIVKVVEYWDSLNSYFKDGVAFLQTMQPKVEKYRKHIRDIAKSSASSQTKVFKQPLAKLCTRENRRVPLVVVAFCDYLAQNALQTQGIFRVSPTKDSMEDLKREIDMGRSYDLSDIQLPHIVSGAFKAFFRELPEPIFTFERYQQFMDAAKQSHADQLASIAKLLKTLPINNYKTLQHVSRLCVQIDAQHSVNMMTSSNLATVLTPNLLYTTNMDPMTMVQEMEQANRIYDTIISNYAFFFPEDDLHLDAIPPEALLAIKSPRSAIEESSNKPPGEGLASSSSTPSVPSTPPTSTPPRPLSMSPLMAQLAASLPERRAATMTGSERAAFLASSDGSSPKSPASPAEEGTPEGTTSKKRRKVARDESINSDAPASPKGNDCEVVEEEGVPKKQKTPRSGRSKKLGRDRSHGASERTETSTESVGAEQAGAGAEASHSTSASLPSYSPLSGSREEPVADEEPQTSPAVSELKKPKKRRTISVSVGAETKFAESIATEDSTSTPTSPKTPKTSTGDNGETTPVPKSVSQSAPSSPTTPSPLTPSPTKPIGTHVSTEAIKPSTAEESSSGTVTPANSPPTLHVLDGSHSAELEPANEEVVDSTPIITPTTLTTHAEEDASASKSSTHPSEAAVSAPTTDSDSKLMDSPKKEQPEASPRSDEPDTEADSKFESSSDAPDAPDAPPVVIVEPSEEKTPTPVESPHLKEADPSVETDAGIEGIIDSLVHSGTHEETADEEVPFILPDPPTQLSLLLDPSLQAVVDAFFAFTRASAEPNLEEEDAASALSHATRELAMAIKTLSSASNMFSSDYPEAESDIEDAMKDLQSSLRELVLSVKGVTNAPSDEDARTSLYQAIGSYAQKIAKLNNSLSTASVQQLTLEAQKAVQRASVQIAPIVRSLLAQSMDMTIEEAKAAVDREVHHILSVTAMISAQVYSPGVALALDKTVDAVQEASSLFWSNAAGSSSNADTHEAGQVLVGNAKSFIASLREMENTLKSCSSDLNDSTALPPSLIVRTSLTSAIDHVSDRVEHGITNDLATRLLLSGAKRTIQTFLESSRGLVSDTNSPAQHDSFLTSLVSFAEAETKLLTYIKYHKIDALGEPPMTLSYTSGSLLALTRAKTAGVAATCLDGTDEADYQLSLLLLIVLRVVRSVGKAILG